MVIPGGAVFVPQLTIGDVEVPASNLAALLIDSEPQPAAGPPQSSGGNFADPVPPLDPGVPLGDLIRPPSCPTRRPSSRIGSSSIANRRSSSRLPITLPAQSMPSTTSTKAGSPRAGPSQRAHSSHRTSRPPPGRSCSRPRTVSTASPSKAPTGPLIHRGRPGHHGEHGDLTITGINLGTGQVTYTYTVLDNTTDGVNDFRISRLWSRTMMAMPRPGRCPSTSTMTYRPH